MGRNDLCFCGSEKKQKKCHADINENSLAASVIRFYYNLESDLEMSNIKTKCQKGCSECCFDFFSISEVEFAIIMEHLLRTSGYDKTMEFIVNGLNFVEKFKAEEPTYYEQLEEDMTGKSITESLRISFNNMPIKQSIPCVFLNDNVCSIYSVRPIICRTHGLCYESENVSEFRICSKMPSFDKYKEKMQCIDKYSKVIESVRKYGKHGKGIQFLRRQYPIFYFIKMYFGDWHLDLKTYFSHPTISNILHHSESQLYEYLINYYGIGKKEV